MRSYKSPAYNFSFFSFAESGYACYKCCKFVNNSTCEVDRRIVMLTDGRPCYHGYCVNVSLFILSWLRWKSLKARRRFNFSDSYNSVNYVQFLQLDLFIHYHTSWGPSWPWSYGNWIYNYLCKQCLTPLKLWVLIPLMVRSTQYSFMW